MKKMKELDHLHQLLRKIKAFRRGVEIAPMCIIPLRIKALREGLEIAPMRQIPLGRQDFRIGGLPPAHSNGRHPTLSNAIQYR